MLFERALKDKTADESVKKKAQSWRGVNIPKDPIHASLFISWCVRNGIFSNMLSRTWDMSDWDENKHELGDDGVYKIWDYIARFIRS